MSASQEPNANPPRRARIPRWSFPLFWIPGVLIVHVLLPWAISLLLPRYGWVDGRPGVFNLLALIPVALGFAGMIWAMAWHYISAPDEAEWGWTPNYLIFKGPYQYSRNPMFAGEALFWLGWAGFYGSLAVLIAALLFWGIMNFYAIPGEERNLEAHFGETYTAYKRAVPRWIGLRRQPPDR